ncbi:MAG: hypothetical protein KA149_12170, partial [Chitinophagales bacterium]|nr:hypothetical protein [Chitinophagales bacterium]
MRYLILVACLSLVRYSSSQKLTFDIFLFGNKIGQTIVEQTIVNDSVTTYKLNSASEAHIFFTTRKIDLHYDIIYKRGQLFSLYSKSTRDGESHITTIQWQNGSYLMKRDAESFCIKPVVDCSTVKLFFIEPCSNEHVFSERIGEYRPLKKKAAGIYEAEMTDGLTYIYHYTSGKLTEIEMRKGLFGSAYLRPAK